MEGPYIRQTTSLDVSNVKPYMSQPMLGLDSSSAMDNDGDGDDSSQSITPTHSPSRITGTRNLPTLNTNVTEAAVQRSAPRTSPPTVTGARGFSHSTPSYKTVAGTPVDGLPTVHQDKHVSIVTITSEPATHSHPKHPSSNASNHTSTRPRPPTRPTPPMPSLPTMSSAGTPESETPSVIGRQTHALPNLSDIPAIRIITPRSSMSKIPAPLTQEPAQQASGTTHINTLKASTSSATNSSNETPRRPPLSLSLPVHRFSSSPNTDGGLIMSTDAGGRLTFIDGGTARLSPSIITRHHPMPILNLPILPVFPSTVNTNSSTPRSHEVHHHNEMTGESQAQTGGNDMRARAARLRSMPALPIRGSTLPQTTSSGSMEGGETSVEEAYGEGEDDDLEDDDMEEGDEMYLDADVDPDGSDGEGEDEGVPRPSMSSGMSGSSSLEVPGQSGRRSRSRSRSRSPLTLTEEQQQNRTLRQNEVNSYGLPQVDTSRLDFSLFNDEPPPVPDKGKGKAKAFNEATPMTTPKATPRAGNSSYTQPPYDYFSQIPLNSNTESAGVRTPRARDALKRPATAYTSPKMTAIPVTMPIPSPGRPGMYKQTSRSMIDILSIAKREQIRQEEEIVQKDVLSKIGGKVLSRKGKAPESKLEDGTETEMGLVRVESSSTLTGLADPDPKPEPTPSQRLSAAPPYDMLSNPLRRRRSMPTFNPAASPPPPYPSFAPHPYPHPMHRDIVIQPRDDEVEGKERLPAYTNSIYLKAIMPRKVEFTKPGLQARDRKWRRVMCVLEGTAFKVYRCPASVAGVGVIGDWWERKVGVGDVSLGTGTAPSGSHSHNSGAGTRIQAVSRAELSSFTKGAVEDIRNSPTQPEPPLVSTSPHTHSSPTTPSPNMTSQSHSTASRSRLNLAVNLLKPGRPHGRTHSDTSHLPKPRSSTSPRSSLSIPRPSFNSGSSDSRSASGPASTSNSHSSSSAAESHSSSDLSISSVPSSTSIPQAYPDSSHIRAKTAALKKGTDLPDPDPSDLIRAYTLQHAESGLGNDYMKRKNVIRVRMEGEQFLLQAKDVVDVVEWIEVRLCLTLSIAFELTVFFIGIPSRHQYCS